MTFLKIAQFLNFRLELVVGQKRILQALLYALRRSVRR